MATLTAHQIQFIEGRLEMMGVEYIDIRYEMTDHIASELETMKGDFYENLRQYIMHNRRSLQQQNKAFAGLAVKKALNVFLKMLARPVVFIAFIVMVTGINFLLSHYTRDNGMILIYTNYVLIITFGVFAGLFCGRFKFSGPEKLMRCISATHFIFMLSIYLIQEYTTDPITVTIETRYVAAVFISIIMLALFSFAGYQHKLKRQFIPS